jgi:hypothetical protein
VCRLWADSRRAAGTIAFSWVRLSPRCGRQEAAVNTALTGACGVCCDILDVFRAVCPGDPSRVDDDNHDDTVRTQQPNSARLRFTHHPVTRAHPAKKHPKHRGNGRLSDRPLPLWLYWSPPVADQSGEFGGPRGTQRCRRRGANLIKASTLARCSRSWSVKHGG